MRKDRSVSFLGAGLLLAGLSVSSMARANTAVPTAKGFGQDDFNVSTLMPYPAKFLFTKGFVDKAKNTPNAAHQTPFKNWDFQFVDEAHQLGSNDLKVATYQAWAVTNDPIKDPGGTSQSRPIVDQDAGGVTSQRPIAR